ncbi:MAG TPA: winged helix-turn-helix domain-containing protein [Pseudomonas sp.]|jgi:predicted ATPase/DNA-binding winged helix-turn-helix (wHTH) protein|uniref:winged helix-turn-helix domain-containing protein n=1 Tax=Pseudomonas sp. TaxID=306 RepID=UPI002ED86290
MISLGQAHVSLELREVFKCGTPLRIGARAFDILELLINRPGRLVTKDEILQKVWPETVVEENNLQVHISALRKALGTDRDLIRTIPGRGYMLISGDEDLSQNSPTGASIVESVLSNPFGCPMLRKNDLPHDVALIGRVTALDEAWQALESASLLTLTGSGGIGKTSLAVAVAHRLSRTQSVPVYFVALGQLNCSERVLDAVACALDVDGVQGQSTLDAVVRRLNEAEPLLVLDNCEHLIEAVASLCAHLAQRCPTLKILATSREALRINGERSMNVAPLDVPEPGASRANILRSDAAQLFLTRLRALDSCFPGDDSDSLDDQSVELIAQVCRTLDGIPLALEMAAARASALGLYELFASLRDDLHLLAGGLRSAPERHQTLLASVEWSYRLLTHDERQVLGRITLLDGRFTLDQACEVAQSLDISRAQVMDAIVGLALKSLLAVLTEGPFKFYRLLGATRTCLVQRLKQAPGTAKSTRSSGQCIELLAFSAPQASLSTLRATHMEQELDHFHRSHQRVLATSQ